MSGEINQRNYSDYVPNYIQEPDPNEYRVGFLRRLAAYLIDMLILILLLTIALFATGQMNELVDATLLFMKSLDDSQLVDTVLKTIPITSTIHLLYFSSELFVGASLGKMVLSLRIGDVNRYPATFPKLLVRYIIKNIGTIISLIIYFFSTIYLEFAGDLLQFIVYIGFLFTMSNNKQAFHDMLSATAVYYNNELIENNNQ
ncbi:MAG: RDD family protein [Candidatus Kapaibacterium sp.]|jgi:uncharacterized RDD family membrane protein YckC|nr:RDD family protein [Candidatus Kapabacteria bacterium]